MLPAVREMGAELVVICPAVPEILADLKTKQKLDFPLLHDAGNAYAAALGIAMTLPDDLVPIYSKFGIDLPKVLSSLGSRHWMIAYPSKIADAVAAGRAAGNASRQLDAASRGAIVWQVADEAPFLKILQQLAPLAGGTLIEEQGFRGVRLPNGPAVFLGMNHLVIGVGDESLEKTIAGIRNPPAGEASLREGDLMRRAAALLPMDPARMFSVGDATKTGGMLGNLREIAAAMQPEDLPEEYRELFAGLKEALPTAADMEGMFGASVATMRMNDEGLVIRSVWEMPPP